MQNVSGEAQRVISFVSDRPVIDLSAFANMLLPYPVQSHLASYEAKHRVYQTDHVANEHYGAYFAVALCDVPYSLSLMEDWAPDLTDKTPIGHRDSLAGQGGGLHGDNLMDMSEHKLKNIIWNIL